MDVFPLGIHSMGAHNKPFVIGLHQENILDYSCRVFEIWQELVWIYISNDSEASVRADSNILQLCSGSYNTLHLTLSPSPLFLLSCIFPLVSLDPPFSTLCSQPRHYLSTAVTSLCSSGLKGIYLPSSVPTSSSDEGSGVKKGRSHEGPITVQLQPHSATRRLTDLGQRRWTERKGERKWHHPTPHLSCFWSIVLTGFVSFGTSPPSALIWQHWLKVIMSGWWLRTSCYVSTGGGSVIE